MKVRKSAKTGEEKPNEANEEGGEGDGLVVKEAKAPKGMKMSLWWWRSPYPLYDWEMRSPCCACPCTACCVDCLQPPGEWCAALGCLDPCFTPLCSALGSPCLLIYPTKCPCPKVKCPNLYELCCCCVIKIECPKCECCECCKNCCTFRTVGCECGLCHITISTRVPAPPPSHPVIIHSQTDHVCAYLSFYYTAMWPECLQCGEEEYGLDKPTKIISRRGEHLGHSMTGESSTSASSTTSNRRSSEQGAGIAIEDHLAAIEDHLAAVEVVSPGKTQAAPPLNRSQSTPPLNRSMTRSQSTRRMSAVMRARNAIRAARGFQLAAAANAPEATTMQR